MNYPKLNEIPTTRDLLDKFKGYNHNLRIGEGEFYDMKNLTGDDYPILSPRKKRGTYGTALKPNGMCSNTKFCYVDGQDFHMVDNEGNDEQYDLKLSLGDKTKDLVSIGSNVVVMPDQRYINTVDISERGTLKNGIYDLPESIQNSDIKAKIGICLLQSGIYGPSNKRYFYKYEEDERGPGLILNEGEAFPPANSSTYGDYILVLKRDGTQQWYRCNYRDLSDGTRYYYWNTTFGAYWSSGPFVGIYALDDDEGYWETTISKIKEITKDPALYTYAGLSGFAGIDGINCGYLCRGPESIGDASELITEFYLDYARTQKVRGFVLRFEDRSEKTDGAPKDYADHFPQIPVSQFLFGAKNWGTIHTMEATISLTIPYNIDPTIPEMDYVIESGNRLWGCHCGPTPTRGFVNEIYASELGNFKNWTPLEDATVATSPYTVSVGTSGKFTGAVNYGGKPIFFKEDCMHRVFGDYPANYQVQTIMCKGVQEGCSKSLAIVNDVLYYKSRSGICAYDGSLPVEISENFGDKQYSNAVGGTIGNKYYVSMKDIETDDYVLFVYDTIKRMWHKEDNTEATQFCNHKGELYYIDRSDRYIHTIKGTGDGVVPEESVKWSAETGILGATTPDNKYVSRIDLRMSVAKGSSVAVHIQYDSMGDWERLMEIEGLTLTTFTIPVIPRRCDHFRLKFEGEGDAKIFSISKTLEETE